MNAPIMIEWADLMDREGAPEDDTAPIAMVRATTAHAIAEDDTGAEDATGEDPGDEDDGDRLAMIARRAGHMSVHK